MHARRQKANERKCFRLGDRVARPQPEALAKIGQDGGVLRDVLAAVEAQRRHASLRIDLEIGLGALLAPGEIDFLRLVFLPNLFQHDMSGHRARARRIIECEHRPSLVV